MDSIINSIVGIRHPCFGNWWPDSYGNGFAEPINRAHHVNHSRRQGNRDHPKGSMLTPCGRTAVCRALPRWKSVHVESQRAVILVRVDSGIETRMAECWYVAHR
jgi:hypothetical protein